MNEIFEYIEYVLDDHRQDIERLESVVYDMRHSKLISEMFYEPMKIGWSNACVCVCVFSLSGRNNSLIFS